MVYCETHGDRDGPYSDSEKAHYLISFNGKYFFETDGFVNRYEREKLAAKNLETLENIRRRNERLIVRGTICLAIGTFLLVVVEVLIHCKEIKALFSFCK
jgi:hypothetical protein